jgi:hypothetical protein
MKKQVLAVLLFAFALLPFTFVNAQKEVSGVKLENKIIVEGRDLTFNGAGVREKWWIDLYVGSLYLPKKSSNASEIVESKDYAIIKIDIVSGLITSEKMINAVDEGFEKAKGGKTASLKTRINEFKNCFKDKFKKGDSFSIVNTPKGVVVYKNGVKKGSMEGHDFKVALFGIWLSNSPADQDLKDDMLGK